MRYILFSLLLVFCGCATAGNLAIQKKDKVDQIKVGVTTKRQVQELIGSPTMVQFGAEGMENWTYVVTTATMNPAAVIPVVGLFANKYETESTTLVLAFDDKGVVHKMAYTEPVTPAQEPPVNNVPSHFR